MFLYHLKLYHGGGEWHCRQCDMPNHGDGLDLICRVKGVGVIGAAKLVAGVLGIDTGAPIPPSNQGEKQEVDRRQSVDASAEEKRQKFNQRYNAAVKRTVQAESDYLKAKGLNGFIFPVRPDGSLLLPLMNGDGVVTGAQSITPEGEKRLLADSVMKGSFVSVGAPPAALENVIIAEGIATALSASLMCSGYVVSAINAGNLSHVAKVMRQRYPKAKIIIAADNDWHLPNELDDNGKPKKNTGKLAAENAANCVSGWVALPPTEYKTDWDDHRQKNGLEVATRDFMNCLHKGEGSDESVIQRSNGATCKEKNRAAPTLSQMVASQRGELLAQRYRQVCTNPESEVVYHYNGVTWDKVMNSELRRAMVAIFNENDTPYSPAGINNAVEAMTLQIPVMGEQSPFLIGFRNGVYDLQAQEFRAHHADDWLLNHNGIVFTSAAAGERLDTHATSFYKWLSHAAGNQIEKMARIKAALFMVLANRYDWQLFIEVTGEGGSGKSVFTHIATMLAGEHNTASGSMMALDSARGRAQFVGKRLITLPDQAKYAGEGTGIKAITGGDMLEIDGKYEKQFSTVIQAVVLATNNEPMTFTERNGGIGRRRVIFPFNVPVSESEKDADLNQKISAELPVIIRHLLVEFADQEKARLLLLEQRNSDEALGVKRGTDPVIDMCASLFFMEEARGLMMGGGRAAMHEPRTYLYHLYLAFMEFQGLGKPLGVESFGKAMKNAAREYGETYKTRLIKGRTQTNVGTHEELVNAFLPHAYGIQTQDTLY